MLATALAAALMALIWAASAGARGGHYGFDGGTAEQRAQASFALQISRFDWNLVLKTITIHLHSGTDTYARPGKIWIDTKLLASGVFAWGPIQHEYAPQVDFFLLDDGKRAILNQALSGTVWSHDGSSAGLHGPDHASLGSERFASTLAWAYWQSRANSLKPTSKSDESAAMAPAVFRALLARLVGRPHETMRVLTVG